MESKPIVLCNIDEKFIAGITPDDFYDLFELKIVPRISQWDASQEELFTVEVLWVGLEENIDSEIVDKFPSLKVIATSTTGLTHIDLPYLRSKGLHLVSIKDEKTLLEKISSTAELAWGLMLVLLRQITIADRLKHFTKEYRTKYFSRQVSGLVVGIIGFGRIGRQLARYAETFGAKWYFYDILPVGVEKEDSFKELDSLIIECDVVFLCASIESECTYPILDSVKIAELKRRSLVINIGRGSLIDERAILDSLKNGRIAGYATDVLRLEEIQQESPVQLTLITQLISEGYNLVVTPHLGGATSDALELVNDNIMSQLTQIYRENQHERLP
jgi:D-3-phosphoglycerate dehydrogenase